MNMKKNIISILLGAAVITLSAGCAKEQLADVEISGAKIVKATIESPATRTTLERGAHGGKIAWVEGESIKINGCVYKCHVDAGNPTVATFEADGMEAVPDEDGKYVAVYPYNLKLDGELVLDATQLWQGNNMERVFPMVAETDDLSKGLEFKNICGLLEIILKGSRTVNSITVCDGTYGLTGAFTVDANGNAVLKEPTSKTSVHLNCKNAQYAPEGAVLTAEGVTFYIAVPAGSYPKFKVFVDSNDGIRVKYNAVKEAVIERNKIYTLEFTPDFGSTEHEGVQLWENGPYWATTYIGAKTPNDMAMFFSWGNTDGYIWNGNSKTFDGLLAGYQFVEDPWYNWTPGGQIDEGDTSNPTVLTSAQDAAVAIWGNGWRMPTLEEAQKLCSLDNDYDETTNEYHFYSLISDEFITIGGNGYANAGAISNKTWSGFFTTSCTGKKNRAKVVVLRPTNPPQVLDQSRFAGWNILPVRDAK